MPSGTVKWFNEEKGYGFIALDDGGDDVFVHAADVQVSGILTLKTGDAVDFDLGSHRRNGKSKAVNLRMIETVGGE